MRRLLKYLVMFFLLNAYAVTGIHAQHTDSLREVKWLGKNPGNLRLFMYDRAPNADSGLKPLVVVLHGCGQSAEEVARLTGWNKLSRLNDFIVTYPQQRYLNNVSGCFNWFREGDINKGQGECESICQMVRYMVHSYPVDSNRVFITGLSAGAAMAVVMLATHPEQFRSGAIFAGGAYKLAGNAFASVGAMAGTQKKEKDELVSLVKEQNPGYTGTYPSLIIYQGMRDLVVNHKNAKLLVSQWTGMHGCDDVADSIQDHYMQVPGLRRFEYNDREGKMVVILYEVDELGHRILVDPGDGPNKGGETGTFGADRNFHSTWQTAKDFGILRQ